METLTYILSFNGDAIAAIQATTIDEVVTKLQTATIEELSVHNDDVEDYEAKIVGEMGNWGETTNILVTYTEEDRKVKETGFTIMKTVCY